MMQRLARPVPQLVRATRQIHPRQLTTTLSSSVSLGNFAFDGNSPVGVGSHATVYLGRYRGMEQDVAIKVMSPFGSKEEMRGSELFHCINQEKRAFDALAASGKRHPNIVDLVSQFESPGDEAKSAGMSLSTEAYENPVHCFVTEFLGGGSLEDTINNKKASGGIFDTREVWDVAVAVCEGLNFLHAQGIVHRDIKPGNLIYSSQGELKLIDFSLAAVARMEEMDDIHGIVGTQGYVAPEVLRDSWAKGGYGPSCDIFSLGCVLHDMLAGAPPTVEPGKGKEKSRVISSLPSTASRATRRFVNSLLAVDAADRPTASDILTMKIQGEMAKSE